MEDLKQQYLDELKRLSNLEYRDEIKIAELKENFNGTLHKEINTVSLTVGADLTIGLRREKSVERPVAITRAHLSRDGGNNQMIGHVGPTSASATFEILTFQQVSGGHVSTIQMCTYFEDILYIGPAGTVHAYTIFQSTPHLHTYNRIRNVLPRNFTTPEYGISEALHPELPGPEDKIVDFPEGKGVPNCRGLAHKCSKRWDASLEYIFLRGRENTGHTPYPHSKTTRDATLLSGIKPHILPGGRDMDMFSLIHAPNPTKVKTGSRPRAAHEVPLLTVTANRVIEVEDPAAAIDSSGVPSTIERSPLDFVNEAGPEDQETIAPEVPLPEDVPTTRGAPEAGPSERVAATDPHAVKECRKRGHDGDDANATPKVLRRDHDDPLPTGSTRGGKSLAAIELGMGSTRPTLVTQSAPADVSDPDPLSFADPRSCPPADVAQSSKGAAAAGVPESENTSSASMVGSPESIYRPEWDIPNGSTLDILEACQDLADHIAPPGGDGVAAATEVRTGSKAAEEICCSSGSRDKRIQARENEIKNLEALLEAEADMKKVAEDKSAKLSKELEDMRALFSDLQVSNERLSQQVSTLQEQRCAEMDARLDALSIDFDKELYPHMLTAIAGYRWMIGSGLRLAVMKCDESIELRQAFADVVSAGIAKGMSEGLKQGVEHGQAQLNLEAIEAYDPEAEAKYIAALQALKNLKYPLVDQLEGLKDAPTDVIMAALHLESDTGDDAPQWVRELHPISSQLTIPVYPEVRDPMDPWACKEEMLLADVIAANVSRAEKKEKCRVVCHTHGVGSAHHARSDGVPESVPTIVPQGLAILLADAATQTGFDEASRLLRSSSLPVMRN
nr:hypothetical protein [Tanacetum cinerariifolium]